MNIKVIKWALAIPYYFLFCLASMWLLSCILIMGPAGLFFMAIQGEAALALALFVGLTLNSLFFFEIESRFELFEEMGAIALIQILSALFSYVIYLAFLENFY